MPYVSLTLTVCLFALGCSEKRPIPAQKTSAGNSTVTANEKEPKMETKQAKVDNAFEPQVADQFYTGDPRELRRQVDDFLDKAKSKAAAKLADRDIVGLVAPHAGYPYSGPVAGEAYAAVRGRDYKTVVVMALSHRKVATKVALLNRPAYNTPLGSLPIDERSIQQLLSDHADLFEANERPFEGEHSLEVQLPFIQVALPSAKVVPIIVAVRDEGLAVRAGKAIYDAFGNRQDILIVASTDLTHFHPYDQAVKDDTHLLDLLEKWQLDKWREVGPTDKGMCGFMPVSVLVSMFGGYDAKKRTVTRIDYRNSGDTTGDHARGVVGYGALAFSVDKGTRTKTGGDFGPFTAADRKYLMNLAKQAVAAAAKGAKFAPDAPVSTLLSNKGAAFVTLKKNGELRGCIGHVIARVPLYQCIMDVARSAAIHDTRFNPVQKDELKTLSYEISVLTAPEPTTPEQVVVGRDGLIMSRGGYSGLLLPQVPVEWGWNKEEFLAHTCRKAGLPLDCWTDPDTQIESFRAIVWGEDDLDK